MVFLLLYMCWLWFVVKIVFFLEPTALIPSFPPVPIFVGRTGQNILPGLRQRLAATGCQTRIQSLTRDQSVVVLVHAFSATKTPFRPQIFDFKRSERSLRTMPSPHSAFTSSSSLSSLYSFINYKKLFHS
jgi:hypothetical protein